MRKKQTQQPQLHFNRRDLAFSGLTGADKLALDKDVKNLYDKIEAEQTQFWENYKTQVIPFDLIFNPPKYGKPILIVGQTPVYQGQITMLSGNPGRGKSSVFGAFLSAMLTGSRGDEYRNLFCRAEVSYNKSIVWIDTERDETTYYNAINQIYRRTGLSQHEFSKFSERLFFQSFAPLTIKQRLDFLRDITDFVPNLGAIFIDGIGDLVLNINDEVESSDLANYLNSICYSYNINIFLTMHTNPKSDGGYDSKPRGHLGTMLLQKSSQSFIILPDKNTGLYKLTSEVGYGKSRSGATSEIYFKWNDESYMFTGVDSPDKPKQGRKKEFAFEKLIDMWDKLIATLPISSTNLAARGLNAQATSREIIEAMSQYFGKSHQNCRARFTELKKPSLDYPFPVFVEAGYGTYTINREQQLR